MEQARHELPRYRLLRRSLYLRQRRGRADVDEKTDASVHGNATAFSRRALASISGVSACRLPLRRRSSSGLSPGVLHPIAKLETSGSISSSEGTMDGASNSRSSSSRSNSSIFCGGDVVVLSMCCRSRSPTSSQIALQCLRPILTASMALVPASRIVSPNYQTINSRNCRLILVKLS